MPNTLFRTPELRTHLWSKPHHTTGNDGAEKPFFWLVGRGLCDRTLLSPQPEIVPLTEFTCCRRPHHSCSRGNGSRAVVHHSLYVDRTRSFVLSVWTARDKNTMHTNKNPRICNDLFLFWIDTENKSAALIFTITIVNYFPFSSHRTWMKTR